MEAQEREQDVQEVHDDAVADAQRMEDQAAELGESIDDAREARDRAHDEMQIAGTGPDPEDDRTPEDPIAPAQEPPGDGD
jgi:hypothetical protein